MFLDCFIVDPTHDAILEHNVHSFTKDAKFHQSSQFGDVGSYRVAFVPLLGMKFMASDLSLMVVDHSGLSKLAPICCKLIAWLHWLYQTPQW